MNAKQVDEKTSRKAYNSTSRKLDSARRALGISQAVAASQSGICKRSIQQYEYGLCSRTDSIANILKYCDYLKGQAKARGWDTSDYEPYALCPDLNFPKPCEVNHE